MPSEGRRGLRERTVPPVTEKCSKEIADEDALDSSGDKNCDVVALADRMGPFNDCCNDYNGGESDCGGEGGRSRSLPSIARFLLSVKVRMGACLYLPINGNTSKRSCF